MICPIMSQNSMIQCETTNCMLWFEGSCAFTDIAISLRDLKFDVANYIRYKS